MTIEQQTMIWSRAAGKMHIAVHTLLLARACFHALLEGCRWETAEELAADDGGGVAVKFEASVAAVTWLAVNFDEVIVVVLTLRISPCYVKGN